MPLQYSYFYKNFYDESRHIRAMTISNPSTFKIVNFSEPFLTVLGYTEAELPGLSLDGLYHPDCYEALEQAKILYSKQGFLSDFPLIIKTKDERKIPVLLDVLPARDKEGNILFHHCLCRKISDLNTEGISDIIKEQEQLESLNEAFIKAQEVYQYFHDFYESAPDMFASMSIGEDIEHIKLTHCNSTLSEKLGYSKEELMDMNVYDLYHPDCWEEILKLRDHFFTHGNVNNWELQLKKKNGTKLQVYKTAKAITDKKGDIVGCISMWRDITDLVETREQLQESNNLLTHQNEEIKTLMHIMSHDIQSPIRAINNFTQFILEENKDNLSSSTLGYLHKLQVNAKRLHQLTQDVISYFFKGSLESIEEISIKDLIDQVLTYLDMPPCIKISVKSGIRSFKTKKTLLTQVLYNLMSNAIKYHHDIDRAEIYIEAIDNKQNLLFTIKDNGPGIPKKFHTTVFEPLQRLQAKDVEGSGMGLAIVKRLITQEGGEITLDSDVGKGATFTFTWPKVVA